MSNNRRLQMQEKTDIFVDTAFKPYNFYLYPPLDSSKRLVAMVNDNGGNVVHDFSQNCIVISSKEFEVPEDLKNAHIYSYEVIQDSANRGSQQEFANYLIHTPLVQDSTPYQYSSERDHVANDSVGSPIDDNPYALANYAPSGQYLLSHGARFFTAEEDSVLFEELRKRPWMGIKGHTVYRTISELPFFKDRQRSPSSLRERVRTLKYKIGYVYQTDRNHKLLRDENGNYLKTTRIDLKLRPYTAAEDLILCKTIYQKLELVTDDRGYETVVFPTNFFDKFANIYSNHTPESWRQRYKNYLVVFGIANFLKYYILEVKQNREPLAANLANKEWLKARKKMKKTDDDRRLYFPNVPQENSFIDEDLEYTELTELQDKNFVFENPFKIYGKPKRLAILNTNDTTVNENKIEEENYTKTKNNIKKFIDEPTTEFKEATFFNIWEKCRTPVDLEKMQNKEKFIQDVVEVFEHSSDQESLKELTSKLIKIGIKDYYALFLMHRCNSRKKLIVNSLLRYIETGGNELLSIEPGVWSNKSIDWLKKNDENLNRLLKDYHGVENFEKQVASFKKSKVINL